MASKVTCSNCGWSWNKSDSSKKDMYVCHQCGRDNSNKSEGWLDKYDDGGTMQEYQENYNDYSVSAPEEMQGDGYSNVGRDYSPAWGGKFEDGGYVPIAQKGLTFLETTSPKLPMGYIIPSNMPSTERASSVGGENGEPAYLIPEFKYGHPLKDPKGEFRNTGEHLGGPFKTYQEAEEWERDVRHPYVEKGQSIPTPIRRWGKDFAMGGSLPGSVGFTYARTQGSAPANGKYTKKTLASAQNGQEMSYYQNGLDFKTKGMKNGGWLDAYDVPQAQDGESFFKAPDVPGYAQGRDVLTPQQVIDVKKYQDDRSQEIVDQIRNKKSTLKQGKKETKKEAEYRIRKNEQFQQSHPYSNIDEQGTLSRSQSDRTMEGLPEAYSRAYYNDQALDKAMTSLEAAGYITGAGELLGAAAPIVKEAVKDAGRYLTEETALKNAYKLNPYAFKPNSEAYYRMIGKEGYADALESGVIRAKPTSGIWDGTQGKVIQYDKPAYDAPYFSIGKPWDKNLVKGKPHMGYKGPYMAEYAADDVVFSKANTLNPSNNIGIPTKTITVDNPNLKIYKEDWLKGYKEVPKPTSINSSVENVGSMYKRPLTDKDIEMYKWFDNELRFDKLPKTKNKESLGVLEDFKTRIQTPEGQKRLKELGIDNDEFLQKLDIVEDPNTFGYYRGNKNKIAMHPYSPFPKKVTRHEIEHGVQEALEKSRINQYKKDVKNFKYLFNKKGKAQARYDTLDPTTEIDDVLSGLELRKEGTPNKVWNRSNSDQPVDISEYKSKILNKQNATDYFLTGSGGKEKSAFLGEVQQHMMDKGMIPKTSYTEITPEMVKETFVNSMFDEQGGGKFLRLFNIMKPTENNYKLISKGLNKMLSIAPYAVPAAIGAGALEQKKEGGVVKDDMGYWNPDNHGKVVEIDSNDITMEGVDQPLIGISDEGDQQYMTPGNNYKFKGTKVREYPMAKNMAKNGKRQEQKGLINLDDLLNFTNYNIPKAQNGDFFGKGKMQTRSGETMTFDQASQILKKSLAPMVAEKAEYINSPLYKKRLVGMGEKDPNQVVKDRLQELKKIQFSSYDPRMNAKVKESLPSTTKKMFRSDKEGKTIGDYPSISLGVGWTPTSAAHELGHVTSSQTDRYVPTPTTGTGETMSPIEAKEFLNLSKAKPEFKKGAFALYDKNVRSNISNPYGAIYDTDLGSSYAKMKNIDEHSIGSGEAKGDLDAVRYLLKKQGITKKYGEDITPETLKKAQQNKNIQKDEFFQRLKKRFSDEDIIKLNNTIAQNNNSSQELTYAKLGTKLKTKGWLEKYN